MFFLFSCLIVSCNNLKNNGYTIQGQLKTIQSGKIYLQKFRNKSFVTIDSSEIKAGKFTFAGSVTDPELYAVILEGAEKPAPFFIENSTIVMSLDTSDIRSFMVKGSASNDLFTAYKKTPEEKFDLHQFILKNPASTVTAYILYRDFSYRLSVSDLERNTNMLDPIIWESTYVVALKELIALLKKVEIGATAPDFTMADTTGKLVTFSSFKGKVILLDFWASWCSYCRTENPTKVLAFHQFKDKGLTIVGVSLDKRKESWEKAIQNDHLAWNHLSSLTKWDNIAVRTYGIRGIPANVLVNQEGKIIAKNVMGERLMAVLDSLLN